jgi:hypothetical protein
MRINQSGVEARATVDTMHEQTMQGVAEGGEVVVKVDPEDPQSLLVWGAAG